MPVMRRTVDSAERAHAGAAEQTRTGAGGGADLAGADRERLMEDAVDEPDDGSASVDRGEEIAAGGGRAVLDAIGRWTDLAEARADEHYRGRNHVRAREPMRLGSWAQVSRPGGDGAHHAELDPGQAQIDEGGLDADRGELAREPAKNAVEGVGRRGAGEIDLPGSAHRRGTRDRRRRDRARGDLRAPWMSTKRDCAASSKERARVTYASG